MFLINIAWVQVFGIFIPLNGIYQNYRLNNDLKYKDKLITIKHIKTY